MISRKSQLIRICRQQFGTDSLRQAIWCPLLIRMGLEPTAKDSPFELLPNKEFWEQVRGYAETHGYSPEESLAELISKWPRIDLNDLTIWHPLMRPKQAD